MNNLEPKPIILPRGAESNFKFKVQAPQEATDWIIPEDDLGLGRAYPGSVLLQGEFLAFGKKLQDAALGTNVPDYNICVDGITYRGHKITSMNESFHALRKMPKTIKPLKELRLPDELSSILVHKNLLGGGLVLVSGEPGHGKTTTCASALIARMEMYGAYCLTIEDPPEMPLHGEQGQNGGYCIQTPIPPGGSFAEALKGAVRSFPANSHNILFLGEVRDVDSAQEMLRIAMGGTLVFATSHGGNVVGTLKRILTLASDKNKDDDEARSLLSSSLRLVIHQRLDRGYPRVEAVFSSDEKSPIASKIRSGSLDALTTDIQQQQLLMEQHKLLASRQW